ncbi:MAG: hypothetical protein WDZ52_10150 [Pseudohongiellaceae bacterium]
MKNRTIITTVTICLMTILAACASRPDAIAPTNVSSADYAELSCSETSTLLTERRTALREAERQQNRAATGDAIGVFLVLLPVGSLLGEDNEGIVAQHKGEVAALERALGGNCDS